jgi:hypothetical protein
MNGAKAKPISCVREGGDGCRRAPPSCALSFVVKKSLRRFIRDERLQAPVRRSS